MPKFVLKRSGNVILMTMLVLVILCGTITYYDNYLKRQRMVNNRLTNQLLAESMVKLSNSDGQSFNYGRTRRISQSQWIVTMKSGEEIKVII